MLNSHFQSQVHTPTLPLITSTTLPKEYIPNIVGKSSIKQGNLVLIINCIFFCTWILIILDI